MALEYRRLRFPPFEWHAGASTVTLNGSVPWRIEARGGLAHVTATLEGVQLLGFELQGDARAIVLSLPDPGARSRCGWPAAPATSPSTAPGEALVSRTVRDLVAGSGIILEGRGTHALKGVGDDWPLFAVSGGGVP